MPLQETSGAASYDAFGGGVPVAPNYIEDVFSTWLYNGNGSTQAINNGLDLAGKGGLVWIKRRNGTFSHVLYDTNRGVNLSLSSDTIGATVNQAPDGVSSFGVAGFSVNGNSQPDNNTAGIYTSWSLRKQPQFFDCVTYTGTGANTTIAHSLGSVPGCIIVKRTDTTSAWQVYHRSLAATQYVVLNTNAAVATGATRWNSTRPTATVFSLGTDATVNASGGTYVAYIFAHNAGGFGLSGTDNVISCGVYTGTGTTSNTVTLGYEPQWVMVKRSTGGTADWRILDVTRGMPDLAGSAKALYANLTDAEDSGQDGIAPTATGFKFFATGASLNASGSNYIYIAIRRGPMKVPTSGTSVFSPNTATDTEGEGTIKTTNFPVDLQIPKAIGGGQSWVVDRLRGISTNTTNSATTLVANASDQETNIYAITRYWGNTGYQISNAIGNAASIYWNFRRAPGFFDEVCYTGNSVAGRQVTHNLTVAPELLIVKRRTGGVDSWYCYAQPLGNTFDILLDSTRAASSADDIWFSTSPTSTNFTVRQYDAVNGSGFNYVAYLFASCPGVSKVGSYTGNGSSQTINCGFTSGSRFVMIKRTDSTGNWIVFDSARGIVSGFDPVLYLNSTASGFTPGANWIDPNTSGFTLPQDGTPTNLNGATYIFLAIS